MFTMLESILTPRWRKVSTNRVCRAVTVQEPVELLPLVYLRFMAFDALRWAPGDRSARSLVGIS
jgi:hypothetical protein